MYNPCMIGKHVYLRHPTEEDVMGRWHQWFRDEQAIKYLPSTRCPQPGTQIYSTSSMFPLKKFR